LAQSLRRLLHHAVPAEFHDPIGLAGRVLRSGPDGRFAVWLAGLGILAAPIDILASGFEKRLYERSDPPRMPMLFVCGPPRSGTTVVALAIARALDVAYVTNLTAMFPRAPILASRAFGARPDGKLLTLRSHYGRTAGMRGWNDGLHLWDRWLGKDRTATDARLGPAEGTAMQRFFGAYERWSQRPLVMKNNGLIFYAAQVARYLPTATFVCLRRDPLYLAQSLLVARSYIHGDDGIPYGRDDPARAHHDDPVDDVCEQVLYYERLTRECEEELGPGRFRVLSYEEFCANPAAFVDRWAADPLAVSSNPDRIPATLEISSRQTVSDDLFARLRLGLGLELHG